MNNLKDLARARYHRFRRRRKQTTTDRRRLDSPEALLPGSILRKEYWFDIQPLKHQRLYSTLKDPMGRTSLDLAIWDANFDIVTRLLDLDAPFDSTYVSVPILLERAITERRDHLVDQLQSHGVKRLSFPLHSLCCVLQDGCRSRSDCLKISSRDLSSFWLAGFVWQPSCKIPTPHCAHVRNRIMDASQTKPTARVAFAAATCSVCQLVDCHRRYIAPYWIQPDAVLSLVLRHVRETQRWELISHIPGTSARKHMVVCIPCM